MRAQIALVSVVSLSIVGLLGLGCGGSDKPSGSLGGLPGAAKLTSLSSTDLDKFCTGSNDKSKMAAADPQVERGACLLLAAAFSSFGTFQTDGGMTGPVASCELSMSTCKPNTEKAMCPGPVMPGCTLSVADVDHCLDLQVAFLRELSKSKCSDLVDATTGMLSIHETASSKAYKSCNAQLDACFGSGSTAHFDAGLPTPYDAGSFSDSDAGF